MKFSEVLQHYAQGQRNFQGANLQCQNFQYQNLSGADFSGADIRSANFSDANLTGTKFINAKVGLCYGWSASLFLVALILALSSGFSFGLLSHFPIWGLSTLVNLEHRMVLWIIFTVSLLFGLSVLRKGMVVFAIAAVLVVLMLMALISQGTATIAVFFAILLLMASIAIGAILFATTFVMAIAGVIPGAIISAIASVAAVTGVIQFAIFSATPFSGEVACLGTLTIAISNFYTSWHTLKTNNSRLWIRSKAIAFKSWRGTRFYRANLANADFTQTKFEYLNFIHHHQGKTQGG